MNFAIPCIKGEDELLAVMVEECIASIEQFHPDSTINLIGDGSLRTLNKRIVLKVSDPCPVIDAPLNYQADWVKARAFKALGFPVWVVDADVVFHRSIEEPATTTAQPHHYPLIPAESQGLEQTEFCTTLGLWFQAVDVSALYSEKFLAVYGGEHKAPSEIAAWYATLNSGGGVDLDTIIVTAHDLDKQPQHPHALHYVAGLKYEHYQTKRRLRDAH